MCLGLSLWMIISGPVRTRLQQQQQQKLQEKQQNLLLLLLQLLAAMDHATLPQSSPSCFAL